MTHRENLTEQEKNFFDYPSINDLVVKNDWDRLSERLSEMILQLTRAYHSPRTLQGDSVTIVKDDLLHIINELSRTQSWAHGLAKTHRNAS